MLLWLGQVIPQQPGSKGVQCFGRGLFIDEGFFHNYTSSNTKLLAEINKSQGFELL